MKLDHAPAEWAMRDLVGHKGKSHADPPHNQPDDASERDKRRLAEELHIATVIDLRSQYVHQSPVGALSQDIIT